MIARAALAICGSILLMAGLAVGSAYGQPLARSISTATHSASDTVLGRPLEQAHAHNDYEHERPLYDALEHGFTSVEADVWLVGGELLVAHEVHEVKAGRTLESLYLDPLQQLVRRHGDSVYPRWGGTFQLMIDIKSEAESTYAAVHDELAEHREIFAHYVHGNVVIRPVVAVASGNRPRQTMQRQQSRYAFYDGRSSDLGSGTPAGFMPIVSENWTRLFTWQGVGPMPQAERDRLQTYVRRAHDAGYRVRFWATPDDPGPAREAVWDELYDADVDHVNTDDLAGLEAFLRAREADQPAA